MTNDNIDFLRLTKKTKVVIALGKNSNFDEEACIKLLLEGLHTLAIKLQAAPSEGCTEACVHLAMIRLVNIIEPRDDALERMLDLVDIACDLGLGLLIQKVEGNE